MPEGEMKVPPMSVQLQMAEAALEIQQVANREATLARTATKNSKDFLGEDADAWIAMALRLDEALAVAEHHAEFLRRSFEQYGPWLNQQIQQTLTSDHFQPDQLEQITTILDVKDGDFSDLGLSLAGTVVEKIPGSRKELRDLAFDIKGMAVPVMDWHHVGCSMIDVAMMAGLALCIPTEGAGCVVALGGMIAHAAFC